MRAGPLRHQVQIQSLSETRYSGRTMNQAWTTAETVRARVEPLTGREAWYSAQIEATAEVKVTLRYYSTLTSRHRLRRISTDSEGVVTVLNTYNILHVRHIEERGRMTVALCKEAVDG